MPPGYSLDGGNLYQITATGKALIDSNVEIAAGVDGYLYDLHTDGHVFRQPPGGSFQSVLNTTDPRCLAVTMALAPNGTLYELNHYGQIYALPQGGNAASWQTVLNTTDPRCLAVTMALAPNGTLYELNHYGQIYALPQGGNAASWQTVLNTTDPRCLAVAMALAPNGTLYELNHYGSALPQGGNAASGSGIRSFALGSDGQLIVTTSYNRNPTADSGHAYSPAPANAPLFNNGQPSYLDVEQGNLGDCWLLASLAEVAARDPQDIKNMFTYDGTTLDNGATVGLYTVRFYSTGGSAVYILVDTELPSGGEYYDFIDNGLGTQALWVALAEKAFAEANALGYVTTSNPGQDSYDALNGGWPSWALQAITGEPATRYSTNPTNIASAWNAGDLIVLDTGDPISSAIVGDHSYAVVGYNASSGKPFEVFNPWGTNASGLVWDLTPANGLRPVHGERSVHLSELHWAVHRRRGDEWGRHRQGGRRAHRAGHPQQRRRPVGDDPLHPAPAHRPRGRRDDGPRLSPAGHGECRRYGPLRRRRPLTRGR